MSTIPVNVARASPDAITIVISTLRAAIDASSCPKKQSALKTISLKLIDQIVKRVQVDYLAPKKNFRFL